MSGRPGAPAGGASRQLAACGAVIAAAFWTIAWLGARPGDAIFLLAVAVAAIAYARAALIVASGAPHAPVLVGACLALALAWRAPMLTVPAESAHDAVRYIWDARVVSAGLDPYSARPDDPALAVLHTEVTRGVDAAWLPTIYPPMAQVYGLAVTALGESIGAFRAAALLADAVVMAALLLILRRIGRPAGWTLLYAWHPLGPLEGAAGAHLEFFGVLLLVLSWLALLHRRSLAAAAAFAAGGAGQAAAPRARATPVAPGPASRHRPGRRGDDTPHGVDRAREPARRIDIGLRRDLPLQRAAVRLAGTRPAARTIAALAVLAGLASAAHMRRTRSIEAPEAWVWPMAIALALSPVIYPWYLIWVLPFTVGRRARPVWIWTLSVLTIYPVWQLHRLGGPFEVPAPLLALEFAAPAIAAAIALGGTRGGNPVASAFRRKPHVRTFTGSEGGGHEMAGAHDARVTVIVPALDEAGTIGALIERLPGPADRVVVADNGSTDGTAALAAAAGARVVHAARRGYGRACLAGIAAAPDSDVFVFLDADLSERPEELPRLVDPILRNEADLVLGRRTGTERPWHARSGTALCVWLINRLWGTR